MTINDFKTWLSTRPLGSSIAYHAGEASLDRIRKPEVNRLFKFTWKAARLGFLHLKQERVGDGFYLYLAEKRRQPARSQKTVKAR